MRFVIDDDKNNKTTKDKEEEDEAEVYSSISCGCDHEKRALIPSYEEVSVGLLSRYMADGDR